MVDVANVKAVNSNDSRLDDFTCSICLEGRNQGDVIVETDCGHLFKLDCLNKWVSNSRVDNTCPICREPIQVVSSPSIIERLESLPPEIILGGVGSLFGAALFPFIVPHTFSSFATLVTAYGMAGALVGFMRCDESDPNGFVSIEDH